MGDGKAVKAESEIETVIGVGRDFKHHFLLTLAFEEARDFVLLVFGYVDEELGDTVHVAAQDERLVLYDREGRVKDMTWTSLSQI